jgi:8-oxo-dGTP diphosphatase
MNWRKMTALHVVGAIIIDKGLILACKRGANKTFAGLWEFPGGKVQNGESSFQAVKRELLEELSLGVTPIVTFNRVSTSVGDLKIDLETIVCRPMSKFHGASTDHDDFRWLSSADLASVEWAAPDIPTVIRLKQVSDLSALLESE